MKHFEEKDLSKKDLILKVTIELIKKEGLEGITVRKIAKLAHINVALVNYYFGSKDKLLNAVIQILVDSLRESFDILDDATRPPRDRLKAFLIQFLHAHRQYPFIGQKLVSEQL